MAGAPPTQRRRGAPVSLPKRPPWEVLAESQAADRPSGALRRATTHGAAVMIIVAAVIGSYSNTLQNGYVLDDEIIIARNQHIRSLANVPRLFTMNWWRMTDVPAAGNLYRPLAAASFALDIAVMRATGQPEDGGMSSARDLNAGFLHGVNVFYHAAACILLYLVLLCLLPGPWRAATACCGAVLFAVHPVHVEAVANLVGRAEILAGVFYFAAAAAWLRGTARGTDRAWWNAGAAVLWLGALLCKEMAVTLPLVLVLLDVVRGVRRTPWRWVAAYAPFVVVLSIYAGMRFAALGGSVLTEYEAMQTGVITYSQRAMTMCHAFATYLRLTVLPVDLCADYGGFPITRSPANPRFLGTLFVHVVLLGGACWLLWRRRSTWSLTMTAAGVVFFYVALFPVSNLVLKVGIILSERALYIPSAGLALSLAATFQTLWTRTATTGAKVIAAAAVTALVVAGVVATRSANEDWVSKRPAVRRRRETSLLRVRRARRHGQRAQDPGSLRGGAAVHRTLDHDAPEPQQPAVSGVVPHGPERYENAIPPLRTLVNTDPRNTDFIRKLATCYLRADRPADALNLLTQSPDLTARDASLATLLQEANARRTETR